MPSYEQRVDSTRRYHKRKAMWKRLRMASLLGFALGSGLLLLVTLLLGSPASTLVYGLATPVFFASLGLLFAIRTLPHH